MAQKRTIQRSAIIFASLAFHALMLTGLALNRVHSLGSAPPDDVFEVTILPRYLTPQEAARRPRQESVLKKDQSQGDAPIPPRILSEIPSPPPTPLAQSAPKLTADQLGQALRNGGVGCNPPGLPGLSREARDICEARLAAGARNARYLGQGLAGDKQAAFDQSSAPGNAWRNNALPAGVGNADVSAEAALKRNQMAPGRPGDTQANWTLGKTPF